MQYEIVFVWNSLIGGQKSYCLEGSEVLQPRLLDFLKALNREADSIVHFDSQSLALAASMNPGLQQLYEKRRGQLLANPRAGVFPPAVFLEHRKTGRCPDVKEITPDMRSYSAGDKEGRLIDFAKMDSAIMEELGRYKSLAEIVAAAAPGYAKNINVFFPRISSLKSAKTPVGSLAWHLQVGAATLTGDIRQSSLCLENCMFEKWELTAEQLSSRHKTSYVALDICRTAFVRIEYDQPEYKEGTVSWLSNELKRSAWSCFLAKMGWGRKQDDCYN